MNPTPLMTKLATKLPLALAYVLYVPHHNSLHDHPTKTVSCWKLVWFGLTSQTNASDCVILIRHSFADMLEKLRL